MGRFDVHLRVRVLLGNTGHLEPSVINLHRPVAGKRPHESVHTQTNWARFLLLDAVGCCPASASRVKGKSGTRCQQDGNRDGSSNCAHRAADVSLVGLPTPAGPPRRISSTHRWGLDAWLCAEHKREHTLKATLRGLLKRAIF